MPVTTLVVLLSVYTAQWSPGLTGPLTAFLQTRGCPVGALKLQERAKVTCMCVPVCVCAHVLRGEALWFESLESEAHRSELERLSHHQPAPCWMGRGAEAQNEKARCEAVSSPWLPAGHAAHKLQWLLGPAGWCPHVADRLSVQAAELQEGGRSLAKDGFEPGLRAGPALREPHRPAGVKVLFRVGLTLVRLALGTTEQRLACPGLLETLGALRSIPPAQLQEEVLMPQVGAPCLPPAAAQQPPAQLGKLRPRESSPSKHRAPYLFSEQQRMWKPQASSGFLWLP